MYCTMGNPLSPPHSITAAELAVSGVYSIGIEKMCLLIAVELYCSLYILYASWVKDSHINTIIIHC